MSVEVHSHQNVYAGSSMIEKGNNLCTTSHILPKDMDLSEGTEIHELPFASSNQLGSSEEQPQKHRSIIPEAVDIAEKLGGDALSGFAVATGVAQSFVGADKSKLIVNQNEIELPCQAYNFPRREMASKSLEPSSAERETYAANVPAKNPLSRLVDVPCQRKMSRGSVWDRLGKPHEEKIAVTDKSCAAHVGDIEKKHYEAGDQPKIPLPAYMENLDRRMKLGVGVLDKSSKSNFYSNDRKHEQKASTVVKPFTENYIWRKRTYSDFSSEPSPFSVSVVQNCVDNHLKERSYNSKKLNSSAEVVDPVLLSHIKEVKQKLLQIEMEMAKLRSKQQVMSEEGQPAVLSNSGVFQYSKEDVDSRTVFASNVHFAGTKEDLSSHFAKCGVVCNVTFADNLKGSAYITFASKGSVEKAVLLNGTSFFSRPLKVVRKGEEAMLTKTKPPLGAVKPLIHTKPAPAKTSMRKPFNPLRVHHHLQWRRSTVPTSSEISQSSIAE